MKRVLAWVCLCGFMVSLTGQVVAEDKKPEKKKPDLEAVFKKIDADGDGFVTLEEMTKGKKEGKAKEAATKLHGRLDKDKDGKVSKEEFLKRGKKAPKKKD